MPIPTTRIRGGGVAGRIDDVIAASSESAVANKLNNPSMRAPLIAIGGGGGGGGFKKKSGPTFKLSLGTPREPEGPHNCVSSPPARRYALPLVAEIPLAPGRPRPPSTLSPTKLWNYSTRYGSAKNVTPDANQDPDREPAPWRSRNRPDPGPPKPGCDNSPEGLSTATSQRSRYRTRTSNSLRRQALRLSSSVQTRAKKAFF